MGFDREGFNDFIQEKFSFSVDAKWMISNLIEYVKKELYLSDEQMVNLLYFVIDDPKLEEIEQFVTKENNLESNKFELETEELER